MVQIRTRRGAATMLVAVLVLLLVAGCSSGSDDATTDTAGVETAASDDAGAPPHLDTTVDAAGDWDADTDQTTETDTDRAADPDPDHADGLDGPAGEEAAGDRAGPSPTAVTLGRRVIRTASLELESADPNRLSQELTRTVTAAGGFVATSDLRRDEQGVLRGTVTVRVPSEALDATLDDLEELADNAPVRRIDERDVTVESADVEAQLANLTAYETELRSLLADVRETTTRPEDLLTVFERIRQVRAEIDQLQGRLAVLADQVSMATITVTIVPSSTAVPVADPTWQPGSTAHDALTAAARTLSGLADAAIWLTLAVLPVLAVVAIPVAVLWLLWRRLRAAQGSSNPPPSGGPTSAAPTSPVA